MRKRLEWEWHDLEMIIRVSQRVRVDQSTAGLKISVGGVHFAMGNLCVKMQMPDNGGPKALGALE